MCTHLRNLRQKLKKGTFLIPLLEMFHSLDPWCLGKKYKLEAAANKAFTELLSSLCQLNYVQLRDSGVQNSVTGKRWLY